MEVYVVVEQKEEGSDFHVSCQVMSLSHRLSCLNVGVTSGAIGKGKVLDVNPRAKSFVLSI